jgi:FlaA1/EpsC-like NDP-sugar epimerase
MKRMRTRLRSRYTVFLYDVLMIPVAWLGAFFLRFNLEAIPAEYLWLPLRYLPIVMIVQGSLFWYFGLYRGAWRFASMPDLLRIVKAVVVGAILTAGALFLFNRLQYIPRSIFVLDALLLLMLLGGSRFVYRWFKDRRLYAPEVRNVLIVGAGRSGEMLVRDMLRETSQVHRPVAFVDDDKAKHGVDIHGVRVAGSCEAIPRLVSKLDVELILLAVPSANSRQVRRIVDICESTDVEFRILPRIRDLVSGEVSINELRKVNIEDLLGRESVSLDWEAIMQGLQGKTVLISGGGGSIGAELCRQVARLRPGHLLICEQSEFNLYSIELELRRTFPEVKLTALLADIRDPVAIDRLLSQHKPQAVFHAAAYKHVPLLEHQLRAAVGNNVLGTRILASHAARHGCEVFVMISTDKAVNPSSVMGMTKRVAEIFCQNLSAISSTRFITVRFGNVLGSAGSVIPLFQQQIAAGGPVTVTHPEITRYFMTIPEAAQLILQASVIGQGGEIFVLDMGEPVKISYLAEQLILLSGKRPGEDIEIVYTGLRPGEKLYEELFHESEKLTGTTHPKIMLANSRSMDFAVLEEKMQGLSQACDRDDAEQLRKLLCELVPEHQSGADPIPAEGGGRGATVIPIRNPVRSA